MRNKIYLLCGPSGAGKTYWAKKNLKQGDYYVSRDEIRYSLLKEGEDYFAHEEQVFNLFIKEIVRLMKLTPELSDIYVDATHLNPISRNKVLSQLPIKQMKCKVVAVNFIGSVDTCLSNNSKRTGRALVPTKTIREMHTRFIPANRHEKFKYDDIIEVKY